MSDVLGATMPVRQQTEGIKIDTTIADRAAWRYVFFPGDVIIAEVKFQQKDKTFGGIHLPQYKTLRYDDNDGMIYRCSITALRPKMIAENKARIAPADRQGWQTKFTLVNGRFDPRTNQWEDVNVGDDPGSIDYLLYKQVYPGDEITPIVRRALPNGEGGVVELTPLKGATPEERDEVQFFFFPDWADIQRGFANLPPTIKKLRAHLRDRLRAIETTFGDDREKAIKMNAIGRLMLEACQRYSNWGIEYVKNIDTSEKYQEKHGTDNPPEVEKAEMVMVQLEMVRKDDLANASQNSTEALTGEMAEQNALKRKELELKERELALKERELKVGQPDTPPIEVRPVVPRPAKEDRTEPITTEPETASCSQIKNNGDPCKGKVTKEVGGLPYCSHHPLKQED